MEKDIHKKLIIGIALGFLFGFGSAWVWLDQKTPEVAGISAGEESKLEIYTEDEVQNQNVLTSESLQVEDQAAGDVVVVKKATLEETAWIVIYEDKDGELGSILGARLFEAGETNQNEVYLLRALTSGKRYYALIHTDSGDRQFDYKEDIAMRENSSDRLIITSFVAQ